MMMTKMTLHLGRYAELTRLYRAAAMQLWSSYEHLSRHTHMSLFVCLSVKRVNCDKTKAPSENKFN